MNTIKHIKKLDKSGAMKVDFIARARRDIAAFNICRRDALLFRRIQSNDCTDVKSGAVALVRVNGYFELMTITKDHDGGTLESIEPDTELDPIDLNDYGFEILGIATCAIHPF